MENGFVTLTETKNKEPRKVPINGLLRSVLQDLPRNGSSYVFYGRTGNKFDETTLHRKFKKALEEGGLKRDFRFHELRHTFGSRFQMEQGYLTATAAIMSHKSLKTTQKYVDPDDYHLQKLASLSENWLTIT